MLDTLFCPFPQTARSDYCLLLEGQILSTDKPCPYRLRCCQLIDDLAACWSQKEIPEA